MAPLADRPSRPVVGAADCAGWQGGEPTVLFAVAMRFLLLFILRVLLAAEQEGYSGGRYFFRASHLVDLIGVKVDYFRVP